MVKKAFNIQNIILLLLFQLLFIPLSHADQVVVTSGRVEYDPFGRAVRVYHPTFDSERVDSFSRAVDNVAPTRTEYDEICPQKNRPFEDMNGVIDNTPHFNIHQRQGTTKLKGEKNHYPYTPKKKK